MLRPATHIRGMIKSVRVQKKSAVKCSEDRRGHFEVKGLKT